MPLTPLPSPVTPSLLPSNQNSSTTLSTSMTSPGKRGSSSETLGRNSNTARTTDPASITHPLEKGTGEDEEEEKEEEEGEEERETAREKEGKERGLDREGERKRRM